jgi:hypothetical protein
VAVVTGQSMLPDCDFVIYAPADFMPRPEKTGDPVLEWLVRRVEVIRGIVPLRLECAPAFNYARDAHTTQIIDDDKSGVPNQITVFSSRNLHLDLRYVTEDSTAGSPSHPVFQELDLRKQGHLGLSVCAEFTLAAHQEVTFVLRVPPENPTTAPTNPTLTPVANRMKVSLVLTYLRRIWSSHYSRAQ